MSVLADPAAAALAPALPPARPQGQAPDLVATLGLTPDVPVALDPVQAARFAARHGALVAGDDDGQAARARKRAALLAGFPVVEARSGYALTRDGVGLVPVFGTLGPERYWVWTSWEQVTASVAAAVTDAQVRAVLLVVDSPGGYVAGCAEAAAEVARLSALGKPVRAVAHDTCCSAAYWLATATQGLAAGPTAVVGSVGALVLHVEFSKALSEWGLTATVVRSAARKAEANALEPLTEAARAQLQLEVDTAANLFVAHVAAARGLSDDQVRATEAACLTAGQGLELGFVDAVEPAAETLTALTALAVGGASPPKATAKATPKPAPKATPKPQPKPARSTRASTRSTAVDEAEQARRRDEIAEIVGEAADTDAARAEQYQAVVAVVERPAPETETEDDGAAALARARAEDRAALALPEAAGRAELVLQLRAKGLSAAEIKTVLGATPVSSFQRARAAAAGQPLGNPAPTDQAAGGTASSLVASYYAASGRKPRGVA